MQRTALGVEAVEKPKKHRNTLIQWFYSELVDSNVKIHSLRSQAKQDGGD